MAIDWDKLNDFFKRAAAAETRDSWNAMFAEAEEFSDSERKAAHEFLASREPADADGAKD